MRRPIAPIVLSILCLLPSAPGASDAPPKPPLALKNPVVDRYWGVDVVDDYRYMEDLGDSMVTKWAEAQNAFTRSILDAYPFREPLAARVKTLVRAEVPEYYGVSERGGVFFAVKRQPPKQQPFLVVLPSLADLSGEKAIVDPNVIDPEGGTSIDFYEPSHDGRHMAVSLSLHGTEDGTLYIYNVATGERLPDEIPRVNGGTAGGSVCWTEANDGLYYTRYPYPGERPEDELPFYQQIWFHKLGTPISEDRYVLGKDFPKIAEIELETNRGGTRVLARVSNGDGGEHEYWILGAEGTWKRFAVFEDEVLDARFGHDGAVYLLSRKDAPRGKILRLPPESADLSHAAIAVRESQATIVGYAAARSRLYVTEMVGGPTQPHVYDCDGRSLGIVDMGEIASVSTPVWLGGDRVLVRHESYVEPGAWYTYTPEMDRPQKTALATTSPADFSDCEVRRLFAPAPDGARIPINVVMRKGTPLDGTAPLLLYAYGCYGISETPRFQPSRLIWIEQGGIYATACIRGGGEYGDAWHKAAYREKKKQSMEDFAACARHLVKQRYTSPERLAIQGGSAGGLLVYGTMTLYPDLMAAVVSDVGFADMLRAEFSPNGEFNTTEFGSVKNEKEFRGMIGYSPYHLVRDGTVYPAVLSLTGMNDPRVEPWQPFKMTARLQASGTPNPVLLRLTMKGGHGGGSLSQREERLVDFYSFLFEKLGVSYLASCPVPK
jgi:prolyl oligopeptidase